MVSHAAALLQQLQLQVPVGTVASSVPADDNIQQWYQRGVLDGALQLLQTLGSGNGDGMTTAMEPPPATSTPAPPGGHQRPSGSTLTTSQGTVFLGLYTMIVRVVLLLP